MREAGVVIITHGNKVLAVERHNEPGKFAFPGGKRERGETPKEGASRELREETGIEAGELVHIYADADQSVEPYFVRAYYAPKWSGVPRPSEEGAVEWLTLEELCDTRSAYPHYNTQAIAALEKQYPEVVAALKEKNESSWTELLSAAISKYERMAMEYNEKILRKFGYKGGKS